MATDPAEQERMINRMFDIAETSVNEWLASYLNLPLETLFDQNTPNEAQPLLYEHPDYPDKFVAFRLKFGSESNVEDRIPEKFRSDQHTAEGFGFLEYCLRHVFFAVRKNILERISSGELNIQQSTGNIQQQSAGEKRLKVLNNIYMTLDSKKLHFKPVYCQESEMRYRYLGDTMRRLRQIDMDEFCIKHGGVVDEKKKERDDELTTMLAEMKELETTFTTQEYKSNAEECQSFCSMDKCISIICDIESDDDMLKNKLVEIPGKMFEDPSDDEDDSSRNIDAVDIADRLAEDLF